MHSFPSLRSEEVNIDRAAEGATSGGEVYLALDGQGLHADGCDGGRLRQPRVWLRDELGPGKGSHDGVLWQEGTPKSQSGRVYITGCCWKGRGPRWWKRKGNGSKITQEEKGREKEKVDAMHRT